MPSPPLPPAALQGFLETLTRHTAAGWARDPVRPARRVTVRALAAGRILAEAPADMFRGDVQSAGLGDGNCGFVVDLSPHATTLADTEVTLIDAETGLVLPGSPAPAADPPSLARFLSRWNDLPKPTLARLRRMMRHRLRGQAVSVLARTRQGLPALLASLQAQLAGTWELIVPKNTLPANTVPAGRAVRVATAPRHPITLVVTAPVILERDALWHLLRAAQAPAAAFLCDHARTLPTGATDLTCRPAFSPDGFRSHPEPGPAFAVRTALADLEKTPADLLLSLAATHPIAHIPRLLHRTTAPLRPSGAAGLRAVRRHLPPGATAALTETGIVTHWPQPHGRTLAIIPTRNQAPLLRRCLDSLFRTRADTPLDIVVIDHESDEPDARAYLRQIAGLVTVMRYEGPFHFARMNNLAAARHGAEAETLLFLNNDTEALNPGWLSRLRSLATRPGVGAVGALLLYEDRRIQHAGVVLGFDGSATHAHAMRHAFAPDGTRRAFLPALQEVSAVTAACMMLRAEVFRSAGGFDEALPIGFNDTDLCLRLRAKGHRILQDNETVLLHHESRTRKPAGQWLHAADTALFQSRWAREIRAGDPFYNPNLRLTALVNELRPDCLPGGPPRISRPSAPTPPDAAPAAAAKPASAAPRRRTPSG